MPVKGKNDIIKFQNYNRKMRIPFVMYGDFECFTEKLPTCKPSNEKSFTHKYQLHTPSGYGLYTKCFDDEVYSPKMRFYTATSRDGNVVDDFNLYLEMQAKGIYEKCLKHNIKMKDLTEEEKREYNKATHCHICEGEIKEKRILYIDKATHLYCKPEINSKAIKCQKQYTKEFWREFYKEEYCSVCNKLFVGEKVGDHCHLTGKYSGAAHKSCNLMYKVPKVIPVIFHNLAKYDAHLFIGDVGKTEGKLNCIAQNEENYISFSKKVKVGS